jgi:hypothetical protein
VQLSCPSRPPNAARSSAVRSVVQIPLGEWEQSVVRCGVSRAPRVGELTSCWEGGRSVRERWGTRGCWSREYTKRWLVGPIARRHRIWLDAEAAAVSAAPRDGTPWAAAQRRGPGRREEELGGERMMCSPVQSMGGHARRCWPDATAGRQRRCTCPQGGSRAGAAEPESRNRRRRGAGRQSPRSAGVHRQWVGGN